jgi:hypothetical protein
MHEQDAIKTAVFELDLNADPDGYKHRTSFILCLLRNDPSPAFASVSHKSVSKACKPRPICQESICFNVLFKKNDLPLQC